MVKKQNSVSEGKLKMTERNENKSAKNPQRKEANVSNRCENSKEDLCNECGHRRSQRRGPSPSQLKCHQ